MAISNYFGAPSLDPSIKTSTTKYEYDPTQEFINRLIAQNYSSGNGTVSPTVTSGIDKMISQPGAIGDIAGDQFAAISKPLLDAQQDAFKIQNQNTMDMFRKAGVGSLQSGAFGQAVRQQAADQGRQQQALLASNYIPLVSQLSNNTLGGINAGLKVPGANMDSLAGILSAYGRAPLSQTTTQTGGNTGGSGGTSYVAQTGGGFDLMSPVETPQAPNWWDRGYDPSLSSPTGRTGA